MEKKQLKTSPEANKAEGSTTYNVDMNKAYFMKKEAREPKWVLIDAAGQVPGRMATKIADILRGKDRATFTPHTDGGDYVVVINTDLIVFTGNKLKGKTYDTYSGWIGNLKTLTAEQIMAKDSTRIMELAVKRMLPKNTLSSSLMKKLKLYKGTEHPHKAQLEGFKRDNI